MKCFPGSETEFVGNTDQQVTKVNRELEVHGAPTTTRAGIFCTRCNQVG